MEVLAELAALGEELSHDVQERNAQISKIEYDSWIDDTYDINFWEFRRKSYWSIGWFEILMDNSVWDKLAYRLGLNTDEIEWCRTYHKFGPTREVFLMLNRKGELENLSLGHVLDHLRKLNQKDKLTRVAWQESIDSFRNGIVKDTFSRKPTSFAPTSFASTSFALKVHQAPEVLVASANVGQLSGEEIQSSHAKPAKSSNKSKFAARIIMFFASDAKAEALRAAHQFRMPQGARKEIGVMILTPANSADIANALLEDPGNSIHKWFKQVDFVVPVLSPQFLRQIQDRDSDPDTLEERQYNRYLYRILLDDYVAKMSKNYKCRALYVPEYCIEVRSSELVKGNGLLQMNWNCSSEEEIEQLGDILISGTRERQRRKVQKASTAP